MRKRNNSLQFAVYSLQFRGLERQESKYQLDYKQYGNISKIGLTVLISIFFEFDFWRSDGLS
jgi:hypothetical protein